MAAKERIVTVELNPRVWYRGRTGRSSALLKRRRVNGYRQQCCIGIACSKTGIPDEVILNKPGIEDIRAVVSIEPAWFARMANLNGDHDLYDINDKRSAALTDDERVKQLNHELKTHDIPLRFRLKKATSGHGAGTKGHAVATSASAAQK